MKIVGGKVTIPELPAKDSEPPPDKAFASTMQERVQQDQRDESRREDDRRAREALTPLPVVSVPPLELPQLVAAPAPEPELAPIELTATPAPAPAVPVAPPEPEIVVTIEPAPLPKMIEAAAATPTPEVVMELAPDEEEPAPDVIVTPETQTTAAPREAKEVAPVEMIPEAREPEPTAHARIVVGEREERVVVSVALRHGTVDVSIRAASDNLNDAAARSFEELDLALRKHGLSLGNYQSGDSGRPREHATPNRARYGGGAADEPLEPSQPVSHDPRLRALA